MARSSAVSTLATLFGARERDRRCSAVPVEEEEPPVFDVWSTLSLEEPGEAAPGLSGFVDQPHADYRSERRIRGVNAV